MSCRELCRRVPEPAVKAYGNGIKRCTTCSVWVLAAGAVRCTCCRQVLRARSRLPPSRRNGGKTNKSNSRKTARVRDGGPDAVSTIAYDYKSMADSAVIRDELEALDVIDDQHRDAKRAIVLEACNKLCEKYAHDKTAVASKLVKLLATDVQLPAGGVKYARVSKRWLYDVLPAHVKRGYVGRHERNAADDRLVAAEQQKHAPPVAVDDVAAQHRRAAGTQAAPPAIEPDAMEDLLAKCRDMLADASTATNAVLRGMRDIRGAGEAEAYKALLDDWHLMVGDGRDPKQMAEQLARQMCGSAQSNWFLSALDECGTTLQAMADLDDFRKKFSTAMKLNLRLMFVVHSYTEMASKITGKKYGSKWMAKIDRDPALAEFSALYRCPGCGLDAQGYIEKARANADAGLELPEASEFCCDLRRPGGPSTSAEVRAARRVSPHWRGAPAGRPGRRKPARKPKK